MGVNRDHWFVIDYRGNDIRCLPADAGKAHQGVYVRGNLGAEVGDKFFRHFYQMSGLGVRVGDALYEAEHLIKRGRGQILGVGETLE